MEGGRGRTRAPPALLALFIAERRKERRDEWVSRRHVQHEAVRTVRANVERAARRGGGRARGGAGRARGREEQQRAHGGAAACSARRCGCVQLCGPCASPGRRRGRGGGGALLRRAALEQPPEEGRALPEPSHAADAVEEGDGRAELELAGGRRVSG